MKWKTIEEMELWWDECHMKDRKEAEDYVASLSKKPKKELFWSPANWIIASSLILALAILVVWIADRHSKQSLEGSAAPVIRKKVTVDRGDGVCGIYETASDSPDCVQSLPTELTVTAGDGITANVYDSGSDFQLNVDEEWLNKKIDERWHHILVNNNRIYLDGKLVVCSGDRDKWGCVEVKE